MRDNKNPRSDRFGGLLSVGDSYRIRTGEPAVRGRCLNRLTKEPDKSNYMILHLLQFDKTLL